MADEILLVQDEFVNYEGLETFKQLEDAEIDAKDAKVLQDAKDYADGLADNYDAAGTAQSKMEELANGQVKTNKEAIEKLNGDDTVEGSVKAQIKAAKAELEQKITDEAYDDTDVKDGIQENKEAIEAINNEETGILKQAKDYVDAKDEAIAAAKKAGDDAQADVDVLEKVVAENADAAKVVLTTAETATEGYLKTYVISQGTTEVGKIDIPKELVVTGGEVVVNPEGQPEGTYVKLTIANQEAPIFINVKDLCDVYTAQQSATQVQLVISDTNEISATIVAGSVGTTELADGAVTAGKLSDDAKALFDEAGAASTAETNAKGHADSLNTTMDGRVGTLETDMTQAKTDIDNVEAAVATKVEQEAYNAKVAELAGEDTAMKGRLDALEEAVGEDGAVGEQIDAKIADLDADVTSATVEEGKGVQVQVVEVDGEITTVNVTGNYDNSYDAKGSAATAKTEAMKAAAADATTKANQAEANAKAEVTALADGAVADNTQAIADIQAAMPTAISNEKIQAMFNKTEG